MHSDDSLLSESNMQGFYICRNKKNSHKTTTDKDMKPLVELDVVSFVIVVFKEFLETSRFFWLVRLSLFLSFFFLLVVSRLLTFTRLPFPQQLKPTKRLHICIKLKKLPFQVFQVHRIPQVFQILHVCGHHNMGVPNSFTMFPLVSASKITAVFS